MRNDTHKLVHDVLTSRMRNRDKDGNIVIKSDDWSTLFVLLTELAGMTDSLIHAQKKALSRARDK